MRLFAKSLLQGNMPKVDCSDWSTPVKINTTNYNQVSFSYAKSIEGFFVFGDIYCRIFTTYDLSDFTNKSITDTSRSLCGIATHKKGYFLAVCRDNTTDKYGYSYSGYQYPQVTLFSTSGSWAKCVFNDLEYFYGYYYALGHKSNTGNSFITKYDTANHSWSTPEEITSDGTTLYQLKRIDDKLIAYFGNVICYKSYTGGWFKRIVDEIDNLRIEDILFFNDQYVVFAKSYSTGKTYVYTSNNLSEFSLLYSYDTHNLDLRNTIGEYYKLFVKSGDDIKTSYNMLDWSNIAKPSHNDSLGKCLCYDGGKLVSVSSQGYVSYKTWKEKE